MGTPRKYAEVITAWALGQSIDFRPTNGNWKPFPEHSSPNFLLLDFEWRITPEKKEPWEVYAKAAYPSTRMKEWPPHVISEVSRGLQAVLEAYNKQELKL